MSVRTWLPRRRMPSFIAGCLAVLFAASVYLCTLSVAGQDGPSGRDEVDRILLLALLAYLLYLACVVVGAVTGRLWLQAVDIGFGRAWSIVALGRYTLSLRMWPGPVRLCWWQRPDKVGAWRRWLPAAVPTAMFGALFTASLLPSVRRMVVAQIGAVWFWPALGVVVVALSWLGLFGMPVSVAGTIPNRLLLWRPHRPLVPVCPVEAAARRNLADLLRACMHDDGAGARRCLERIRRAGTAPEQITELECMVLGAEGRYGVGAELAATLLRPASGLAVRYYFCEFTALATLAGDTLPAGQLSEARSQWTLPLPWAPTAQLASLYALLAGEADTAVTLAEQAVRWAGSRRAAGRAHLLTAMAHGALGQQREARAALRRGTRLAPGDPVITVATTRLRSPTEWDLRVKPA